MTVRFYIPRREGAEKGFEHTFERNAAVEIANQFHKTYHYSSHHYALVFNLDRPPADLVVITNNGVGVADFKNITGAVRGTVDSQWTIHLHDTERKLEISRRYKNPFQQVRTYRFDLYHMMKDYARDGDNMPSWMARSGQFHLQAAVVFTDDCDIQLDLDPDRTKPWFEAIQMTKIAQWAYTLTFSASGGRDPLSEGQITALCEDLLDAEPWEELESLIEGSEVFGYLSMYDAAGNVPTHHPLANLVTTLGREADNDILIGATGISRHHARIIHDGGVVYLEDLGSTNGTWLNAERLSENERRELYDGDALVFGPCADGKPLENARRAQYTTRITSTPATQVFYRV